MIKTSQCGLGSKPTYCVKDTGTSLTPPILLSRLGLLLVHLLKWQYQPEWCDKSWHSKIKEQRQRIARLLDKKSSLKAQLAEVLINSYSDGVLIAVRETPCDEEDFPAECPFSLEQTLNADYWPD